MNTKELESLLKKMYKFRARVVPIAAGVLTKQIKVLSQQQQRSYDGTSFRPLSKAYAKRKVGAGHQGVPNLTYTGKFIDRIGLRQDEDIPYVGVIDSFQPQAQGLDKLRKICGVHPDSERLTEQALEEAWEGIVNAS